MDIAARTGEPAAPRPAALARAAALIGLLWAAPPPAAPSGARAQAPGDGSGVLVAVVGSGIDYTHAALGGPGTAAAHAGNDPGVVEPATFPNAVVVGGYDLAGEAYSADCPSPAPPDVRCAAAPQPDGDPLDGAGGSGTTAAGILRAAAPGARLVALKAFGRPEGAPATTDLALDAARWILAHNRGEAVPGTAPAGGRIDIALFDVDRAYGTVRPELARAIAELAASGVAVVAPAGDHGQRPMAVGGVAALPQVLAATAVHGPGETAWGVRTAWVDAGGQARSSALEALEGTGLPRLAEAGPIVAALAWHGLACNVDGQPAEPAQPVDGRVALVERGTCPFAEKLAGARAHGARAVLFFSDNRAPIAPSCGGACPEPSRLPAAMIARADGLALRELLVAGTAVTVTLDAELRIVRTWLDGVLLGDGARGPAPDGAVKPQVAALGADVPAPVAASGDGMASADGSLAAAATTAALAARLVERARAGGLALDGADVAALIQSGARDDVFEGRNDSGVRASVARRGAGRIDASAPDATALVRSADGIGHLGFGLVSASASPARRVRRLVVRNLAASERTFDVRFEPADPSADVGAVALDPPRIVVGGGATAPLTVALTVDPVRLPPRAASDGAALVGASGLPAAVEGRVVLDEVGAAFDGERLVVPLHALPRGASCVGIGPTIGPGEAVVANDCPVTGTLRAARIVGQDPAESASEGGPTPPGLDIVAVGFRHGPLDPADPASPRVMEWHVATAGARAIPAGARFDVWIDRDRDGAWDRVVTGVHGPQARGAAPEGAWVALAVAPWEGGGRREPPDLSGPYPEILRVAYDLEESVAVLRVPAAALLFDPASGGEAFDMAVTAHRTASAAPWPADLVDVAPDAADEGSRFAYDQDRADCARLTAGDAPLDQAGADRLVAPGERLPVAIVPAERCADEDAAGAAFLLGYPTNDPAGPSGQHQRLGLDGPGSGPVYLPVAHGRP